MEFLRHGEIDYVIRRPENELERKKYPLVIYVHGAGGRGRDISLIKNHCFFSHSAPYLKDAISVAPQCYANSWFDIFEQLQDFIEFVISDDAVDCQRVYLLGASMGGYTTWQLGMTRPELFAALVPICGGGMYWNAGRLKNVPIWAHHGEIDNVVLLAESEKMVNAVNAAGGNARLTVYEGVAHPAWPKVYASWEVFEWLLSHKRAGAKVDSSEYNDRTKFG